MRKIICSKYFKICYRKYLKENGTVVWKRGRERLEKGEFILYNMDYIMEIFFELRDFEIFNWNFLVDKEKVIIGLFSGLNG